ncbi:hypothetical protein N7G274_000517 [Stereocaulon virgatum]|uniref:Uncharacterized protein n=1 Tax=Stereocaulon virgatum TaxID=373712 RepID=A0ABR4ASD3_9LECA
MTFPSMQVVLKRNLPVHGIRIMGSCRAMVRLNVTSHTALKATLWSPFHPSLQPHPKLSLTLPPALIMYVEFRPDVHVVELGKTSRVSLEIPSNSILVVTNRLTSHDRSSLCQLVLFMRSQSVGLNQD